MSRSDQQPVSVILPVFNRQETVGRAIASVLAQGHPDLELIVVDDGSTDESRAAIAPFSERLTLLSQPHGGAYAARNLGLRHARGALIAFIDSDDAWRPDRLARQLPLLDRPEVGLVFGDAQIGGPAGRCPGTPGNTFFRNEPPHRGRVAADLVMGNFVATSTVLVRRRCLDEIGGFSQDRRRAADFLAWFRIALRHELDFVPDVVADYTVHPGNLSADPGRVLEACIALFSAELEHSADSAQRRLIEQLLFNRSLHLLLATLRGRARRVDRPL